MKRSADQQMRASVGLLLALLTLAPLMSSARSKNDEGNRFYREGEYAEALKSYTEAQLDSPDAPELHYNLGNVFYRQGELEKAREEYQRALVAARPELDPKAVYNLGNAYFSQNQFQDALAAYQRTLKLDPDDLDAKRNLELTLLKMQEQEQPRAQPQQDSQEGKDEESQPQPPPQEGDEPNQGQESQPTGEDQGQEAQRPREERGGQKRLTRDEAEQILGALEEDEKENLRQRLRVTREKQKRVERDW